MDAAGVDVIVLNGDLADGPMPAQTLDRLEIGERAIWVGGNGDRWLVEAFDGTFQDAEALAVFTQTVHEQAMTG